MVRDALVVTVLQYCQRRYRHIDDGLRLHCGRDLGGHSRWRNVKPIIAEALDAGIRVVVEQSIELIVGAVKNRIALSLPKEAPPALLTLIDSNPLDLNMFLRVAMQDPSFGGRR